MYSFSQTDLQLSAFFASEKNPFADSFRAAQVATVMPSPLGQTQSQGPDIPQEQPTRSDSESPDTKRDRRKEKNRLAAQACRQRKIDKYEDRSLFIVCFLG